MEPIELSVKEQGEGVSSETADQREPQDAGDAGDADGKGIPSFDWSDGELRAHLAAVWGYKDPSRIAVIGRLRLVDGADFAFLEDLHHPELGTRLLPPVAGDGGRPSIFVPDGEVKGFRASGGPESFAFAEIDLSPLSRRKDRADVLACKVRRGTLEPLSRIPESWWDPRSVDGVELPLVLERARRAIEQKLSTETAVLKNELDSAREALRSAADEKEGLDEERRRVMAEINGGVERLKDLDAELTQRRESLETKFRELEAFLKERGERMMALDLIDQADLEKILPHTGTPEEREGHGFRADLGGSFERLSAYTQAYLWRRGIRYTRAQLMDFLALLRTNDLIVLAGDSGSGKTSLVKSIASAIGGRCTIVPVKPNWTSSDDLLGYYNPIERRFRPSQFLLALLDAAREPHVPHIICLDEMNLARVEYYFADFLSLLESRSEAPWIHLYSAAEERHVVIDNKIFLTLEKEARRRSGLPDGASFEDILINDEANIELRKLAGLEDADTVVTYHGRVRRSLAGLIDIPPGFRFPSNVWVVGAINVDETTHYLSPKILDRAHIMRFRNPVLIEWDEIEKELEDFDLDMTLPVALHPEELGVRGEYPEFDRTNPLVRLLVELARKYLDPLGIEFGLRAIRQSIHYIRKAEDAGVSQVGALNNVILHKVLPKVILDVEKSAPDGRKRLDILNDLKDSLSEALKGLEPSEVTASAVQALEELIARASGNNGIANFWAR